MFSPILQPKMVGVPNPTFDARFILTPYYPADIGGVAILQGGSAGFGLSASSNARASFSARTPYDVASKGELSFLVFRVVSSASTSIPFMFEVSGGYWRFGLINNGYTFRTRNVTTGDTGTGQDLAMGASSPAGSLEVICGTYSVSNSLKALYLNGIRKATSSTSITAMTSTASASKGFGTLDNSSWGHTAPVFLIAVADRIWSDSQIQELSQNPWLIFAPEPLRIWVPSAATGTTLTPGVAALTITPYAPTVAQPWAGTPGVAALTLT